MEFNLVSPGLELIGTTVKKLTVDNSIVNMSQDAKRSFGLNINEPEFEIMDDTIFAQMLIDFEIEIEQENDMSCGIELSIEGAFLSDGEIDNTRFEELVRINGAVALIGIARGKIESISASILNSGKIVIPFVNIVDYYKEQ